MHDSHPRPDSACRLCKRFSLAPHSNNRPKASSQRGSVRFQLQGPSTVLKRSGINERFFCPRHGLNTPAPAQSSLFPWSRIQYARQYTCNTPSPSRMQLALLLLLISFALATGAAPTGSPTGSPSTSPTPSPSAPSPRPTEAWEEWVRTTDRPSTFPTPAPSTFPTIVPSPVPTPTSEPTGVWLAPPPTGGTPFSSAYEKQSVAGKISILCGLFFVPLIGVGVWVLAKRWVEGRIRFTKSTSLEIYDAPDTEHVGTQNPLVPGSGHSDAGLLATVTTPSRNGFFSNGDPSSYSLDKKPAFYVV